MELEGVVCWRNGESWQVYMASKVQRCIAVPCHLELCTLEEVFCRRCVALLVH